MFVDVFLMELWKFVAAQVKYSTSSSESCADAPWEASGMAARLNPSELNVLCIGRRSMRPESSWSTGSRETIVLLPCSVRFLTELSMNCEVSGNLGLVAVLDDRSTGYILEMNDYLTAA